MVPTALVGHEWSEGGTDLSDLVPFPSPLSHVPSTGSPIQENPPFGIFDSGPKSVQNLPKTSQNQPTAGPNRLNIGPKPANTDPKPAKHENIRLRAGISVVVADIHPRADPAKPYDTWYLKAVWPDLLGCLFEVWPAPGARESPQKGGGRSPHQMGGF